MRYVGSPSAPVPPSGLDPFELVNTAGGGGWNNSTNPKAIYDSVSGKTFWAFIRQSDGHPCVAQLVNSTGVVTVTSLATTAEDLHNGPALHLRASDRRLICIYTKHNVAYMQQRISTNVADATAWDAATNVAAGLSANNLTYPCIVELSTEAAGTMHLFFRNYNGTNFSWRESVSTNDGASWPAAAQMFTQGTLQAYVHILDNGTDTIHFVASDTIPVIGNTVKLAHMYRTAGSYYGTDGTLITPVGTINFADMTQFWDGAGGAAPFVFDVALDASGYPVVAHEDGRSSTDWRYNLSRWNGTAWGSVELAAGYDSVPGAGAAGGFCINHANVNQLYVSAQQPSGRYEMEHWISADGGATWPTKQAITVTSTVDQFYPVTVRDAAAECRVIWASGTMTSWLNFNFAIMGAADA